MIVYLNTTPPNATAIRLMTSGKKNGKQTDTNDTAVIFDTKKKAKKPNLYRVLLLNDDYTPMEFVIFVLQQFFRKSREEATQIMLAVHHAGIGECGVFSFEVAESKVAQVLESARKHQHPLQCLMEKK